MRIALVHPKFGGIGGAERYALSLAAGLHSRGHDVELYGRRVTGRPVDLPFRRVPVLALGRAWKTRSFCWAADRALRGRRFDVVQGFGKTTCQNVHRTGGGVHRSYLRRSGGDGNSAYDRAVLRIEDQLFSGPQLRAVICPSRWVADEVAHFYPQVRERLVVIPNGVDTACCAPGGREADRSWVAAEFGVPIDLPLLLFVATNFALKGLARALDALAHMPQARLLVVGGDSADPFSALANELGVAARVHFAGARRDVVPFYRAADVLVHPTDYDPFANVCLEALACGTPVATTDRNGAADVLGADCGAVLPVSADGAGLAAAVEGLLLRGEQGRAAARRTAEQCDQQRHLAAVETVYQRVRQD